MAYDFDHNLKVINVTSPQDTVDIQTLINEIRIEESTERGIIYDQIATASGKESLGSGVSVGITVELINDWQLKFWDGNYIAKIAGGNLVGGIGGDPVAYSPGVQVLLIQSAASTVVSLGGSVPTATEIADAVWDESISEHQSTNSAGKTLKQNNTLLKVGL